MASIRGFVCGAAIAGVVCLEAPLGVLHPARVISASPAAQGPNAAVAAADPSARPVLDRYCVTCHNEKLKTAGLAIDPLSIDRAADAPSWEKIVRKLRTGTMPPVGLPRPDQSVYDTVAASLETALDRHNTAAPNPGRSAVHRLNRTEYTNVLRDLLALDIDARVLLPADDAAFGFDNNADVLTLSPGLLERYMSAARRISRLAIADTMPRPAVESYEVSRYLVQDDRVSENLPFGTRGGVAVRHHFPLDAEYEVRVQVGRRRSREPQELEVRIDGERIGLFTVGGGPAMRSDDGDGQAAPDGRLAARVPVKAGPHLVGVSLVQRNAAAEGTAPAQLPVASISFAGKRGAETSVEQVDIAGPYEALLPEETPSRQRVFVCRPSHAPRATATGTAARRDASEDTACAKQILSTLARRAYRRPITDRDLQKLLAFYTADREKGGFDTGIRSALERILVDPQFLFRIERDPSSIASGTPYRVNDLELASRLSFFLWSSMPDDELLDAGARVLMPSPRPTFRPRRRL